MAKKTQEKTKEKYMGGRSSASGMTSGTPKLNNPAGIPSNAITEEEFLHMRGVGYSVSGAGIDMIGGANQTRMSDKQRQKLQQKISQERNTYYERRQTARQEYKSLVDSGKIRDKTPVEKMLTKAHGNPDSASTQAARRMAEKHGYDWRTGKKAK